MFYKTLNGARVGDVFMSLIYTAELNDVPPFECKRAAVTHGFDVAIGQSCVKLADLRAYPHGCRAR